MPDDAAAFTRLYHEHHAPVLAYCRRRCAGESDARDAVAETFVVAWRRFDELPSQPLPWLLGVARRVLANQRRGDRRRSALTERVAATAPTATAGTEDRAADRLTIRAALARLSPHDQEVLRLWAWDALPAADAAAILGCSTSAFHVRLLRAKRRLRSELPDASLDPRSAHA
jgi:RNA polymerase sigma-70 factor (ECF subfamily)